MTQFENTISGLIIGCIVGLIIGVTILIALIPSNSITPIISNPKTFEDTYNKAYEQCLTEQQNNTKITNKEYYCVNYATAKVR